VIPRPQQVRDSLADNHDMDQPPSITMTLRPHLVSPIPSASQPFQQIFICPLYESSIADTDIPSPAPPPPPIIDGRGMTRRPQQFYPLIMLHLTLSFCFSQRASHCFRYQIGCVSCLLLSQTAHAGEDLRPSRLFPMLFSYCLRPQIARLTGDCFGDDLVYTPDRI